MSIWDVLFLLMYLMFLYYVVHIEYLVEITLHHTYYRLPSNLYCKSIKLCSLPFRIQLKLKTIIFILIISKKAVFHKSHPLSEMNECQHIIHNFPFHDKFTIKHNNLSQIVLHYYSIFLNTIFILITF